MLYVNYLNKAEKKNTAECLSHLKELDQFVSWLLTEVS